MKTKRELENLNTKKLLDIYRMKRKALYCNFDIDNLEEYCDLIKSVLDTRGTFLTKEDAKKTLYACI